MKSQEPETWHGPRGWRGEALAPYRAFAFHDLPWTALQRRGELNNGVECVKASRSRKVLRLDAERRDSGGATEAVFAKRYLVTSWRRRLGNRLAGSKAAREFALGHALLRAGIPTPLPLAYARHRIPFRARSKQGLAILQPASYLLTRQWPNSGSVKEWLKDRSSRTQWLAPLLARFLAKAHDQGFYHDDCAADHILLAPLETLDSTRVPMAFIDIDNGKLYSNPVPPGRRAINIFQILRSVSFAAFPPDLRVSFVADYLKAARPGTRVSPEAFRSSIDRIARGKIGRSVFTPRWRTSGDR
ncbi:hypothetical protein IIC65_04790 [Candidatus Sumerlaeota bacterium]|nr:hypothetical protein [Candidatus Sumerlaeota bacterium]